MNRIPRSTCPRRRGLAAPTGGLRGRGGFTLIELLVAIAILGILGTVVIQKVWTHIDEAKQTSTMTKLKEVETQVMMYRRKHNELPSDLEVLTQPDMMNNGNAWLDPEDILDAWDNKMIIKAGDKSGDFEIISFGENRQQDDFTPELGYARDLGSKHRSTPPRSERVRRAAASGRESAESIVT